MNGTEIQKFYISLFNIYIHILICIIYWKFKIKLRVKPLFSGPTLTLSVIRKR